MITKNAFYGVVSANSYSQGGLIVFNKDSQAWSDYSVNEFGVESRIDLTNIVKVGEKIYLTDSKNVWVTSEDNIDLQKIETIPQQLQSIINDYFNIKLIGDRNGELLISSDFSIYSYNDENKTVDYLYPTFTHSKNPLVNANIIDYENNKIWIKQFNESDIFINWLDIKNFEVGHVILKDRSLSFDKIVAVINGKPLVHTSSGYEEYDPTENEFELLFDDLGLTKLFEPIPNSSKILIFTQECGTGCPEPLFTIYDFANNSFKYIEPPSDLVEKYYKRTSVGEVYYPGIHPGGKAPNNSLYAFTVGFDYIEEDAFYIYDALSDSWETYESLPRSFISIPRPPVAYPGCNKEYEFLNNKFIQIGCHFVAETAHYKWEIDGAQIKQTNKSNNSVAILNPPRVPSPYSSFSNSEIDPVIKDLFYAHNYVWVPMDRGLARYNPTTSEWVLYSTDNGLMSNDLDSVVVTENIIWATTGSGGLSGISY